MRDQFVVTHTDDLGESHVENVGEWSEAVQTAVRYFAEGHVAKVKWHSVVVWEAGNGVPPGDPRLEVQQ